ncbi:MAG: 50S ribosomal protein L16 [Candidatus Micrarchaeaceae archaeon]
MKLRPARTMRYLKSQAWSRYSVKKPRKNYVKALPHTSLLVFRMGDETKDYNLVLTLNADQYIQLRSNALESARLVANKHLERKLPAQYFFRIITYPHMVIREKKRATGAGADRLSQGMSMSFGRPVSVAARIGKGKPVLEIRVNSNNRVIAKEALKRAAAKLSGSYTIQTKSFNK